MKTLLKTITAGLALSGALLLAGGAWAADYKERTLKFSYLNAKEHPQGLGAQKFADIVAAKSGGKIKVRLFPGGTLGGDVQTLSALQGGTVEMTVMNTGILVSLAKEFAAVDMPFLFNSPAEADALLDGPFGAMLYGKLPDKGLVGLAYWDLGFRNLTNNRHPVAKVEDVSGLKVRVIQTPIYIDMFRALGANPVPLSFTELYTALETRTVDGQENPSKTIELTKFYEVQKYLTVTRHIYNPQSLLMSKAFWDKLTPDEQTLFREAAAEATAYQRQISRAQDAEALNALKAKGMQVTELAPEELARFRAKTEPVTEKYKAEIGPDVVGQMMDAIKAVRGGQ